MIDTHAHLQDPAFDADLDAVVERAIKAGINGCLVVAEHPQDAEKIQEICQRYENWAFPCIGLYPKYHTAEDIAAFDAALARYDNWVGIGEVGLDGWIAEDEETKAQQELAFRHVVKKAIERDLPLNIHTRAATLRTIHILQELGATKVHLHAVEAKRSTIMLGVEAGYYFSIPLSVLHTPQKQKLAQTVPLDKLMLETDSPVLAPVRGERNEPMNLALGLEKVAELLQMKPDAMRSQLRENTQRLYRCFTTLSSV